VFSQSVSSAVFGIRLRGGSFTSVLKEYYRCDRSVPFANKVRWSFWPV
jgi:hypothetical protein